MKTRLLITSILSFTLALLFSTNVQSKTKGDFTKPYKKEFSINKGATLKVNSEFTDIKAYNWNKDVISIEVTVSLDAKNESKAEDRFNKIIVDMNGSSDLVTLTTGFKSNISNNGNNHIEIEALIYYPSHIQLDLDSEFGSCLFENIDGIVNAKLAYGDFDVQKLNHNELDVDVEFGKFRAQKFQAGKIEVAYGGFECQYVGVLNLDSEFSSVEIEEVNQIELETAYDKIFIGNCDVAFIESEFSGIRIDEISKSLELDIAYGNFNLKSINTDFDRIKIKSEFTGFTLYFNEPLNFAFKAEAEMGDFNYPKSLAKVTYLEKEMMELSIEGYFGNAKGQEPKLIINLENGSATVKTK